ncbi:MAG: lysophospholipid acyltransferase family protein [Acidimicrobiales bacterium]
MGEEREYGRLYPVARAILRPMMRALYRVEAEGLENVPETGPAVICPNHISFMDSLFVPMVLPRRISYVGKAEYLDNWKTRRLFPALGMIPIERGGGSASQRALDTAAGVLERGELFGIYPEGTRSRDGKLHKGHTGPARLALRTGAPLIPVGIIGTDRIQPPDSRVPRVFKSCTIRFGRPIDVEGHRHRGDDPMLFRELIDELMFEIRELTGQEYVHAYATKKPEALPAETVVIPSANGQARRTAAEAMAQRAADHA